MVLPSSFMRPLPAATTLACCGFSLAVSGMMMPPTRCSCSSTRFTRTRSRRGRTFMGMLPSGRVDHVFYELAPILCLVKHMICVYKTHIWPRTKTRETGSQPELIANHAEDSFSGPSRISDHDVVCRYRRC